MTLPEARAFGALALFGETYGEQVRVVEIGGPWSRELCGGTHVRGSAQIGTLALTGESSVGSGLAPRRGGRRARGLPLPGPRARPGPPARRPAEGAAGRPRRAGQRHARPAARRGQGARRAARRSRSVAAAGQLAAGATDVGGVARGHRLAGRPRRRRPAHARARRPRPAAGRPAGRGPAGVGVRWQGGARGRAEPGRTRPRAVGQRRAAGGRAARSAAAAAERRTSPRAAERIPRESPRHCRPASRRLQPPREGDQRVRTPSTTPRTPARSADGGASCRPFRRPGRAPPPAPQPTYHPTTELDLGRGFPPVSNETTEIDLSGGWPQHLKVPPPPARPRSPRAAGCSASTSARCGSALALSDPTGTLASPLETLRRAKNQSDLDRLAALVVEHEVTEVVVGEPVHLSGASGASARGRGQLRSGTSRPHSGCAGDPDRRKALDRDRSQSPA